MKLLAGISGKSDSRHDIKNSPRCGKKLNHVSVSSRPGPTSGVDKDGDLQTAHDQLGHSLMKMELKIGTFWQKLPPAAENTEGHHQGRSSY